MNKRLVAGPWCGEFGWELLSWQAYIRKLGKKYDTVIISTFEGHEALYADFTSNFISHHLSGIKDCWRMISNGSSIKLEIMRRLASFKDDWLQPTRYIPINEPRST